MKLDATLINRRELMAEAQRKMDALVESFFVKYKHMPAKDEIVFFCNNCHWWDDTHRDVFVKPVDKPHILGIVQTVDLCCPECFNPIKAAHTKMFTENMPDKIANRKNKHIYTGISLNGQSS